MAFDLVAKAPVVNMTQFNGEYGCLVCTHPGYHISCGCHANHEPSPVARTHASIRKAGQEAEASGVPVRGIKGISVLANSLDPVDNFTTLLPELYGERSCTANAYLLIHLPKYIRLWGPLWTHSAFGFESCNGHLKYLFHSQANILGCAANSSAITSITTAKRIG